MGKACSFCNIFVLLVLCLSFSVGLEYKRHNLLTGAQRRAALVAAHLVSSLVPLALLTYSPSASLAEEGIAATTENVARIPKNVKKSGEDYISDKEMLKRTEESSQKIIALKAYIDEAERNVFSKKWDTLQAYLTTFSEQDQAFSVLIQQLFPNADELDTTERKALSFEAQSIFLAIDDLKDATHYSDYPKAEAAYAQLLLSYDRFLKAGGLYDTYDTITSTEVFFQNTKTPLASLRFDSSSPPGVLDRVIFVSGPDMGKLGYIIHIDEGEGTETGSSTGRGAGAIVKLDKDGRTYQEVKYVKRKLIAKAMLD